jgi:hypothetical protein
MLRTNPNSAKDHSKEANDLLRPVVSFLGRVACLWALVHICSPLCAFKPAEKVKPNLKYMDREFPW